MVWVVREFQVCMSLNMIRTCVMILLRILRQDLIPSKIITEKLYLKPNIETQETHWKYNFLA